MYCDISPAVAHPARMAAFAPAAWILSGGPASVLEATAPRVPEAVFDSGRPVLIAPPRAPDVIGDTVLIAWNRSSETARTVAFAAA